MVETLFFYRLILSGCLKCIYTFHTPITKFMAVSANRKAQAGLTTRENTAPILGFLNSQI